MGLVLSLSLKGIDGGDQFGVGTKLAHIKPMFSQGDISRTDSYTDLAIHGDGFFTVKAKFGKGFTRDGSLHFNKKGELVNSDNYNVMGFPSDGNGKFVNKLEAIKMSGSTIPASSTTKVTFDMNLDSRATLQEFDIIIDRYPVTPQYLCNLIDSGAQTVTTPITEEL